MLGGTYLQNKHVLIISVLKKLLLSGMETNANSISIVLKHKAHIKEEQRKNKEFLSKCLFMCKSVNFKNSND